MTVAHARSGPAVLCLFLWLAAGCGGSGSSGFDGAVRSEAEAIGVATSEGVCVRLKSTTYCGPGALLDVGDDVVSVDFPETAGPLPCTSEGDEQSCSSTVDFHPSGLPASTALVGAWAHGPLGPWTLSDVESDKPGTEDPDDGGVIIEVPGSDGQPTAVVVAVLAFFDGRPDGLPQTAAMLRDFGADVVFLSLPVEVDTPPAP
jgi:hypothetical protein